jgi:hypothetical protein
MSLNCSPDTVTQQYTELYDLYTALLESNDNLRTYIQKEIDDTRLSSCPCSSAAYDHELKTIVQIYENLLNKIQK